MGTFTVPRMERAGGAMLMRAYGGTPIGRAPAPSRAAPAPASAPTGGGAGGATAITGGSEIMDLYTKALERLSTGGMALEASLADIEEGKKQAIGRGQQALVSGGLGGTTVMGGVPIAAEKAAGRARLGARGEAESKYLTTLASYAAFAQRAQESAAERSAAMERLQMQISSQERLATQQFGAQERLTELNRPAPVSQSEVGGPSYMAMYGGGTPQDTPRTTYAQQFPSIYGEAEEPVPQWM